MSIVCAARTANEIAIACDTQSNFGSLTVSAKHMANANKLFVVNDNVIGIVGWNAISDVVAHLIKHDKKLFQLNSRMGIIRL